ncbi:MAG: ArnT family glycosyltransferase [Bdellovibrionota bacterium]
MSQERDVFMIGFPYPLGSQLLLDFQDLLVSTRVPGYHQPVTDSRRPARNFALVLGLAILARLGAAALLPIDGDEAYYQRWSDHLSWGYYDHPPMVAWVLHLARLFGKSLLVSRLPEVFLMPVLGALAYWHWRERDPEKGRLSAVLLCLWPIGCVPFVSVDLPFTFFSFSTLILLWQALESGSLLFFGLAGFCFGFAVLSKYLAVAFLMGIVSYCLVFERRNKRAWAGLAVFAAFAVPPVAVNIIWNYMNCWSNFVFQLRNRFIDARFLRDFRFFLWAQLLLFTPVPFYYWLKRGGLFVKSLHARDHTQLFIWCGALGLAFMGFTAARKGYLLPWAYPFYPVLILGLTQFLPHAELRRIAWFFGAITGSLAIGLLVSMKILDPRELLSRNPMLNVFVLYRDPGRVLKFLEPYDQEHFQIGAVDFPEAAIASLATGRYVVVFPIGSSYGRFDDENFDFRTMDHKDLVLYSYNPIDVGSLQPYFKSTETKTVSSEGLAYYLAIGHGFDFQNYRSAVLQTVKDRFYAIPSWLPQGGCPFVERYFPN